MQHIKIGIIGLGYVGLPLATLFSQHYAVVGFDINEKRIEALSHGTDSTLEVGEEQLLSALKKENNTAHGLYFSSQIDDLYSCNYYIVTVPTPVDINNQADLTPLLKATITVGQVLQKNDIVIYESTVYPGVTEEKCVPVLEKHSGLQFNTDFLVGYSPERINPGDKSRSIKHI